MAIKSKAKAKKKTQPKAKRAKVAVRTQLDRDIDHVMALLANTERNITDKNTVIDQIFATQAERLKKSLKVLRGSK